LVAWSVPGHPNIANMAWAVLAGVGTAIGSGFLYRGLASGRMGVAAPVSAVGAGLVPVLVGVAAGERLSWIVALGVFSALPGIWLVSTVPASGRRRPGAGRGRRAGALCCPLASATERRPASGSGSCSAHAVDGYPARRT
jgi:drug/metabolite transporter (DMT)-like permease